MSLPRGRVHPLGNIARAGGVPPPNTMEPQQPLSSDSASADRPMEIQSLVERVGMINRIHAALRSTLNPEDIYSIILTTLVSRSALNLSRAILAVCDDAQGLLRGLTALGAPDREAHERIQNEIAEEEEALADMVRDLGELDEARGEEDLFRQSLQELSSHSFWITTFQKFSGSNVLLDATRKMKLPCTPQADTPGASFLSEVLTRPGATVFSHRQLQAARLDPQLLELLAGDSLWAVIRTQKGTRLLIIADKLYQDEPLAESDKLHVEWFVGQVALALENAEMFKDLEGAYNSLRELDRMKSNFLATISHELRTPLTAITGYVQLLIGSKVGELSPGQKEVLERILAHGELLTGKVNDLIEIAELDSRQTLEMQMGAVDPLNVLMTVLPRVENRRAHKNIRLEPIVIESIPRILANADALERILFHLLDNAIKFSHPNGRVHVEFDPRGEELAVVIRDEGIGISEHQIQNIFEAFYQIDNRLTRSYEGLGIGLAIIKKQLDHTGGRIEVESAPGRGSTFTVLYPVVTEAETAGAS